LPAQVADPDKLARLDIRRRDRLGGILMWNGPVNNDGAVL
jgi:hypothetical protein